MRIFLLTLILMSSFYYLNRSQSPEAPSIDSIKVKISAPDRVERILTVEDPVIVSAEEAQMLQETEEEVPEQGAEEVSNVVSDLEHVEDVQINDLEEGWSNELKEMLSRLEPMEGETIHTSYLQELESYQTELNVLLDEKHQKENPEEAQEIEYMIGQLDLRHQERLRDIFGAHYEAVRDHYEYFMETASGQE